MRRNWSHAERVLELPSVLEIVATRCETSLGMDVVWSLKPLFDADAIRARLDRTSEARRLLEDSEIPIYSNARDVRESVTSAGKGARLTGEALFGVRETLGAMGRLRRFLLGNREGSPALWRLGDALAYLPAIEKALEAAIGPEGEVLDSAGAELKRIRSQRATQQRRITDRLQSLVSGPLRTYLQEPIFTQRQGRYVVPVKAQYRSKVQGLVHDASGSGQTLFVEPEALVGEMNKLRELEAAEQEEVERILGELSKRVGEHAEEIAAGLCALAELDAVFAKGRFALERESEPPALAGGRFLRITEGHHPLIDRDVSVAVTVAVGGAHRSLLLTGPNTGGKTVTLKLIGLYALMIGCGIFPPAARVEYGPFADVWADIGDEQSLQQSLSTFSAHLKNIAETFAGAREGSLVLLDEIGAGTDPREGAALGKAILTTLVERGATVAASTHFGELKQFALETESLASAAMEFDFATLKPTYHLIPGASGASHALEISRRYGMPDDVVDAAERFLGSEAALEREKSRVLDELIADARRERELAQEIKRRTEDERTGLEDERQKLREKMAKLRDRSEEAISEAIREARETYRRLLEMVNEAVKKRGLSGKESDELLADAKAVETELRSSAAGLEDESGEKPSVALEVGMEVTVKGHPRAGKIIGVQRSGAVVVQIDAIKMTVKREDVQPAKAPAGTKARPPRPAASRDISLSKTENLSGELVLRKMNADEAQRVLEKYLDDAVLAGFDKVRLIHGKGDGVLRRVVRYALSKRTDIESISDAGPREGGAGVTIVRFKP